MSANSPIVKDSHIEIAYNWTTGKAIGRFLTELRDNKKIKGLKCPACGKVYVPPHDICEVCYVEMNEWVDLEGTGTLKSYCIVNKETPNQPLKPPYAVGLIRLDGADTDFMHLIGDVDHKTIQCGMRLKPRWKDQTEGDILDIAYFRPV
jgi:uncharacterized OB-fold protein